MTGVRVGGFAAIRRTYGDSAYSRDMTRGAVSAVRFLWTAVRGHRLRPWRSPYVQWRVETYSGQKAETVGLRDCLRLVYGERRQFTRFAHWLGVMRGLAGGQKE